MEPGHSTYSFLPALLVLIPLAGSFLAYLAGRKSGPLRDLISAVAAGLTLAGSVALIPLVGRLHHVECALPLLFGEIRFYVDPLGMLFALFTSFVWFASTVYSISYMTHEKKRTRYQASSLAALAANMGVVLAGDLITLYLFFEGLGIIAYLLIVHSETEEAKEASVKYLWMTVAGGFALLVGIFLAYGLGSTGLIEPIYQAGSGEGARWAAALLMILGFGVKAGMLPVHIWLPDAHPAAPSPASALLSGVMIKAGAYGIFRVVTSLFRPPLVEHAAEGLWHFTGLLGLVVLWIGMATMFVGVVLALLQENSKRMLAYHSISQMGFILAGVGAAGYLGGHGAMGVGGGLYHVVNHALFKACLFLGVGAVFFRTGELNMYRLGGLWRKMPLTFLFTLIAAFGISGVPLFNGFISKCLIHHALVEAYHYHGLFSLKLAEVIYIVTCGGTACSFMKLIIFVFLGKPKGDHSGIREAPPLMLAGMGLLALPIVVLGLKPHLLIDGIFVPGLHVIGLHAGVLEGVAAFTGENLLSVLYALAIGALAFIVGVRFGLFHVHIPARLTIDHWYVAAFQGSIDLCRMAGGVYERWLFDLSRVLARLGKVLTVSVAHVRESWRLATVTLLTGAPSLREQQFIEWAYALLDNERQAGIRQALEVAREEFGKNDTLDADKYQKKICAAYEIASYMGARLFNERMGVVGDLAHRKEAYPLVGVLEKVLAELEESREVVAMTAVWLAERRTRGENVVREIVAATDGLLKEEKLALRFRRILEREGPLPPSAAVGKVGLVAPFLARRRLKEAYLASFFTPLAKLRKRILDLNRLAVVFVMQERVPWMVEEHMDEESILAIRKSIRRYGRDLNMNIAVIAVVFLLLFLAII